MLPADGNDHAIQLANDTHYGLTAGVMSENLHDGMEVARRLRTGIVHVNDQTVADEPQAPFGGIQDSGYGRFGGQVGIDSCACVVLRDAAARVSSASADGRMIDTGHGLLESRTVMRRRSLGLWCEPGRCGIPSYAETSGEGTICMSSVSAIMRHGHAGQLVTVVVEGVELLAHRSGVPPGQRIEPPRTAGPARV